MLFARGPVRRCSRQSRMHETKVRCRPMHTCELGILSWSMLSPRAKSEMIGIAPSQSSVLVSRDGWSSALPMCRTALRPACKMLGLSLGISMATSTMAPLVWQDPANRRNAQGRGASVPRLLVRRPHARDRVRARTCTELNCGCCASPQGQGKLYRQRSRQWYHW